VCLIHVVDLFRIHFFNSGGLHVVKIPEIEESHRCYQVVPSCAETQKHIEHRGTNNDASGIHFRLSQVARRPKNTNSFTSRCPKLRGDPTEKQTNLHNQ
jgi:hypothetical protein